MCMMLPEKGLNAFVNSSLTYLLFDDLELL